MWGIARFSDAESRSAVDALGVTTRVCDISSGDFTGVPDDFTYVVHLAAFQGPGLDFDHAIAVNAEGTGLLLAHCRTAKAALVMSTHSVYRPDDDPLHVYRETDPLGEVNSSLSPPYSMSKIAQEAVARTCARQFDLPVVIARMNASYGPNGGLPVYHLDAAVAGERVTTRWDPCPYMPIHEDDINEQTAALLEAATVPARIVNWGGDDAVIGAGVVRVLRRAHRPRRTRRRRRDAGHVAGLDRRPDRPAGDHRSVPGALERRPARRVRGEVPVNVLVTGASSGIGAATAIAFAQRGATVGHLRPAG